MVDNDTSARTVEGKASVSTDCCVVIVWSAEGKVSARTEYDVTYAGSVEGAVFVNTGSIVIVVRNDVDANTGNCANRVWSVEDQVFASIKGNANSVGNVLVRLPSAPLKAAPSTGMRLQASYGFRGICSVCTQETRRL
jgi:hypothetical protein